MQYIYYENNMTIACKIYMTDNSTVNNTADSTMAEIAVLDTTNVTINEGGFTFTTTAITVPDTGIYRISSTCYLESTVARSCVVNGFAINGVFQSERSGTGYIRASSGHNEASLHLTAIYNLTASDDISLIFGREAQTGTVNLQGAESAINIIKLSD